MGIMGSPKQYPVEDLVTVAMIAEEHRVPLATARRWTDSDRNNNFPTPVERVGKVKFYVRADVERWVALHNMTKRSRNGHARLAD